MAVSWYFTHMNFAVRVVMRPLEAWFETMLHPNDGGRCRHAEGRAIGRDQLDSIYRVEAPKLRALLRAKVWLEDERADLVQEAFARLAASRSSAAQENPGAYLQGILRHLLADRVRRWSKTRSLGEADLALGREPLGPDAAAEISQMQERYRAAVESLPPKTREVYLLHRVEDMEYKLIAARLGISIRTVEWHVAQAIIRISKSVGKDG
ncbi:RNA polymerase sigma factor [Novosphingobium naphthalenivorans]|uniref:RNA polymerase sigma factor n=1 Tax=Novosphingobium naphthalenivorans TaxID=273168 RepID=UPI001FDFF744|nr:RNA polymerase sigma factor [Novosphingobium naphthalenivorans]